MYITYSYMQCMTGASPISEVPEEIRPVHHQLPGSPSNACHADFCRIEDENKMTAE